MSGVQNLLCADFKQNESQCHMTHINDIPFCLTVI